jgi:hypothetical protein
MTWATPAKLQSTTRLGSWSPAILLAALLSDFRLEHCGPQVVRRASFGDIEALAGGLPMLPQRSYRVGCKQGIVVLAAAVIGGWLLWRCRSSLTQIAPTVEGKTAKQQNPYPKSSLAWAAWLIARIGGWSGYETQRPPGMPTFVRGLRQFDATFLGWKMALVCTR